MRSTAPTRRRVGGRRRFFERSKISTGFSSPKLSCSSSARAACSAFFFQEPLTNSSSTGMDFLGITRPTVD